MPTEEEIAAAAAADDNEDETSMRDDIEKSIEDISADDTKEESASMDGLLPEKIPSALPEDKEGSGKEGEAKAGEGEEAGKAEGESAGSEKLAEGESAAEDKTSLKAPVGWTPESRESWSKVPKDIQKVILTRENEIAQTMQNTQAARQTHDTIGKLANSYAPIMAAEGVKDPMQAIQGLFETVAQLRVGNPQQKAQRMAMMINHYGIDIQALDSALVGEGGVPSPDAQLQNMIDQRMQPVNQLLGELQGRQQEAQVQSQQEAEQEITNFKGEFFEDVRMDMADLMDMASSRNQSMNIQEAYDKAIILRPEIQSILKKRSDDAALLDNNQNLQNKENAASSIMGRKAGDGGAMGGGTMRDTLNEAWDDSASQI
jgi:F0F1-type ATP synthase membrane subunit b/b'